MWCPEANRMEGMDRVAVIRVRCCWEVQKYKDRNAFRTQWHGNTETVVSASLVVMVKIEVKVGWARKWR